MNVVLDKLNGSKKAGAGVTRKSAATGRWHLEVGDGGKASGGREPQREIVL